MTRRPAPTIHALPIGSHGNHRASLTCPCRPIEATELMSGPLGRLIVVHRDLEPVPVLRRIDWHPLGKRNPNAPDGVA